MKLNHQLLSNAFDSFVFFCVSFDSVSVDCALDSPFGLSGRFKEPQVGTRFAFKMKAKKSEKIAKKNKQN